MGKLLKLVFWILVFGLMPFQILPQVWKHEELWDAAMLSLVVVGSSLLMISREMRKYLGEEVD